MTYSDAILKLFMQLSIILIACQITSYIGKRFFAQSSVVCEIVAGALLGPSLLGMIFPSFQSWLFPKAPLVLMTGESIPNPSMMILYALSQVALVLYMFLIGLDFNTRLLKSNFKPASIISVSGIVVPFLLGAIAIFVMPNREDLFQPQISLDSAIIFLGASLSITAFPVMARILEENKITHTSFGTLALAAGSMGDLAAWIMLACLLSFIKGNISIIFVAIIGALFYFAFILSTRRVLAKSPKLLEQNTEDFQKQLLTMVLAMLMLCAWFTDKIGIYSVFGAFLVGVALPRGIFSENIKSHCQTLVNTLLLPIFFVFSGLNTQIGLLNSCALWMSAFIIIVIAIIGKGVGCMLAARLVGENWRDSCTIGALMNARGLMELIIINIGLQEGIITPALFTILVIMTIITTLAATPLYYLFQKH